jgi:hypothetical protein
MRASAGEESCGFAVASEASAAQPSRDQIQPIEAAVAVPALPNQGDMETLGAAGNHTNGPGEGLETHG